MATSFCLLIVSLFAIAVGQQTGAVTYTYSNPAAFAAHQSDFQFNMNAADANDGLVLTPATYSQAGSVFLKNPVFLNGSNGFQASFSTAFSFVITQGGGGMDTDGVWGADGLVFCVNSVSSNEGSVGGGIGYSGIPRSVGIEYDTWNNGYGGGYNDVNGNHIGIDTNGNIASVTQLAYPTPLNNGQTYYSWVDFDGTSKTLSVRINTVNSKPSSAFLSTTVDLVSILQTPAVYIGFTSGTGGAFERHVINSWSFTNQYAPNFTVPSAVCGNGIVETGEACDGGACCTSTCTFSTAVCRPSAGACDVAETCSGSSASCPADSFQSSSTVCRPSNGPCDVAESCTGSSASCPADSFQSSSTVCRPSAGVCDVAESCSGSDASCPADSFQSSSTVCRPSAGVCDVAESCSGSSASCPADGFQPSSTVCRASIGPCDPSESCTGNGALCPSDVNGHIETACPGLNLQVGSNSFSALNYDVISFGGFVATTSDFAGRGLIRNNAATGSGWSVGYDTHSVSTDLVLPYAMIVGGNFNFPSGAVYPDGISHPTGYAKEGMFVGSTFTGPSYLGEDVSGSCTQSGCLNSQMDALQSCYAGYQTAMTQSDNVQHTIQWSSMTVNCSSATASAYYISLTPIELRRFSSQVFNGCSSTAKWTVTITGTSDVTISEVAFGAGFAPSGSVTYNVVGSGRKINVNGIQLTANLIAPYNYLYQSGGVIIGRVVVGDIDQSWQMNKAVCYVAQ